MAPPPAWPNSGLKPLVSTENSVMASTEGVRKAVSTTSALRFVFTEMPSRVAPNAPPCPPPRTTLPPLPLASAITCTRSNTLRIAPPTTSGSLSICSLDTLVVIFASSVWTALFTATTLTDSASAPGVSVTSTRAAAPGGDADALDPRRLEPHDRGLQAVDARRQAGDAVGAGVGREHGGRRVGGGVDHLHRDAGDHGARRVLHDAGDAAALGLRRRGRGGSDDQDRTEQEPHTLDEHDVLRGRAFPGHAARPAADQLNRLAREAARSYTDQLRKSPAHIDLTRLPREPPGTVAPGHLTLRRWRAARYWS